MNSILRNKALLAEAALFVTALLWGFSFIFQRKAMDFLSPIAYMGIRFTFGGLLLVPFALRNLKNRTSLSRDPAGLLRSNLRWCLAAGLLLSVGSALQQYGLLWTTVAKAGFITSLYVVLVPLLLLAAGRKILPGELVGALLALIGLFLLSVTESLGLSVGDSLVLVGAFVWAAHVIWLGKVSPRMDSFVLGAGQALVCGLLGLGMMLVLGETPGADMLAAAWPYILFGGLCSVTLGFTLQVYGQAEASPSAAAIILQLEAVFAAFFGWLVLDEAMTARMLIGAAVMFAGVLTSQLWPRRVADGPVA